MNIFLNQSVVFYFTLLLLFFFFFFFLQFMNDCKDYCGNKLQLPKD